MEKSERIFTHPCEKSINKLRNGEMGGGLRRLSAPLTSVLEEDFDGRPAKQGKGKAWRNRLSAAGRAHLLSMREAAWEKARGRVLAGKLGVDGLRQAGAAALCNPSI